MMHIELKIGESVQIGNAIVSLDEKSGKTARISIDADKSVLIRRVHQQNTENNKQNITRKPIFG